jgi:uncharacterized OB-fold protein
MTNEAPDPRPTIVRSDGRWMLAGSECTACGYRLAVARPRCPVCRGTLREALWGPEGTVWSAATQRVPVPDLEPPVTFGYLDLDGGPRVLVQAETAEPAPAPGTRMVLAGRSTSGNPLARSLP